MYPTGFDHAAFRSLAKAATAGAGQKMQAIPELMYFLDKDPTVSAFFRNRKPFFCWGWYLGFGVGIVGLCA